ncbi:MAG: enoyl-CoA hydratase-related protein [Pigmentiphaga sp.]|nr:enoyl-CoA hydratase-related protein [Pigmentiphaga sp.]
MTTPSVIWAVHDHIATITLADEGGMNPLGDACVAGMEQAVAQIRHEAAARAVILTARGRGFSVGADLAEYRNRIDDPGQRAVLGPYVGELMARMNQVILDLKALPIPVVCAVNGVAAGGGAGLALAGDLVIAARSAYFYLPFFPALGAVPDMGLSWLLPRALGRARAMGLALTGDRLSAAQAREWGLIWSCAEDQGLAAEALALARRLAAMPPQAIREARAIFAAAETNDLKAQLALERSRQMLLVQTDAFAEGVRAFSERREPGFWPA